MMLSNIGLEPISYYTNGRDLVVSADHIPIAVQDRQRHYGAYGSAVNATPGPTSYRAANTLPPNFWQYTKVEGGGSDMDYTRVNPIPSTQPVVRARSHQVPLIPTASVVPMRDHYESGNVALKRPREERHVILNTIPKVVDNDL